MQKRIFVTFINNLAKSANFQQLQNFLEFCNWACELKVKVKSSIDEWINIAGGEADKLLLLLRDKTDRWWIVDRSESRVVIVWR